jgi:hypothetical protein
MVMVAAGIVFRGAGLVAGRLVDDIAERAAPVTPDAHLDGLAVGVSAARHSPDGDKRRRSEQNFFQLDPP